MKEYNIIYLGGVLETIKANSPKEAIKIFYEKYPESDIRVYAKLNKNYWR